MSKETKAPAGLKVMWPACFVEGLFAKSRKELFLDKHSLAGMKTKDLGLKNGKAFFNMDKKELSIKEGSWEVTAAMEKQDIELKNAFDKTTTVKFGCDGLGKEPKVWCGGASKVGPLSVDGKVYADLAAEVSCKTSVSGLDLAADLKLDQGKGPKGQFGASYALPFGKKTSVGAILSYPEMDSAVCAFGNVAVPGTKSATLGCELQLPAGKAPNALFGGKFGLDDQLSVKTAAGLNGLCHIFFIQAFKDCTLTTGMEADLFSGSPTPSKFGIELKMAK